MPEADNREYIRHPSDIPLLYTLMDEALYNAKSTNNISIGGLSFVANEDIKVNSWLAITIPIYQDKFEAIGQVRWCRANKDLSADSSANSFFDVGVQFSDSLDAFSIRMIEQICHIEQYKKEVLKKEKRKLSNDEAASEWIEKFATKFPQHF
jgi:hypothetical protein